MSRSEDAITVTEAEAAFRLLRPYRHAVLAVSGGPDSVGLLVLADAWRRTGPERVPAMSVATVDHMLRPESAAEADDVARLCARLGWAHATLRWQGTKPDRGLPNAARDARYALLARHASAFSADGEPVAVVTAHTEDDQAETVFMRLARGVGPRGLAAMSPVRPLPCAEGPSCVDIVRPLLAFSKRRIIATLAAHNIGFAEDPTNADHAFERPRVRAALEASGLDPSALARTARHMQATLSVIDYAKAAFARSLGLSFNGGVFAGVDRAVFDAAPPQLCEELLRDLITAFGGSTPAPEAAEIARLVESLRGANGATLRATLGGTVVSAGARRLRLWREPGRIAAEPVPLRPGEPVIWDRRFRLASTKPGAPAASVRPLGMEGYRRLSETVSKSDRPPAGAAYGLPAVYRGDRLIAVPPLGFSTEPDLECTACEPLRGLGLC